MNEIKQKSILNNVVSPYGLALISYIFFLLACLIPPSVYIHYMGEPDLMFLDPATILFYSLCVASFMAGVWFISWLFPCSMVVHDHLRTRISPMAFLLGPLVLGIVAATVLNIYMVVHFPVILLSLMAQHGNQIKDTLTFENDANSHLTFVPLALIGITWWALSRCSSFGMQRWKRRIIAAFIFIAYLSVLVYATLTVSRALLMLAVGGLMILLLVRKIARNGISYRFVLVNGVAAILSVSLLFMGFAFLRGTIDLDDQVHSLFGYTVASYNRLAAIVNGDLRYPFGGRGIYLSNVVAHSHYLMLSEIMHSPDYLDQWGSEFGAISRAGLDDSLIWSGAFGYIFADLGWFSFLFTFGYGVLYGFTWNWISQGKILGIVLYPFFGFCILYWIGSNYLLDAPSEVLLLTGMILVAYEHLFVRPPAITN